MQSIDLQLIQCHSCICLCFCHGCDLFFHCIDDALVCLDDSGVFEFLLLEYFEFTTGLFFFVSEACLYIESLLLEFSLFCSRFCEDLLCVRCLGSLDRLVCGVCLCQVSLFFECCEFLLEFRNLFDVTDCEVFASYRKCILIREVSDAILDLVCEVYFLSSEVMEFVFYVRYFLADLCISISHLISCVVIEVFEFFRDFSQVLESILELFDSVSVFFLQFLLGFYLILDDILGIFERVLLELLFFFGSCFLCCSTIAGSFFRVFCKLCIALCQFEVELPGRVEFCLSFTDHTIGLERSHLIDFSGQVFFCLDILSDRFVSLVSYLLVGLHKFFVLLVTTSWCDTTQLDCS